MKEQKQLVTVWVTKYALSSGIKKEEAELAGEKFVVVKNKNSFDSYYHNNDFWFTEHEAKAHAEQMRVKKIASLQKQIKKLEQLKF